MASLSFEDASALLFEMERIVLRRMLGSVERSFDGLREGELHTASDVGVIVATAKESQWTRFRVTWRLKGRDDLQPRRISRHRLLNKLTGLDYF